MMIKNELKSRGLGCNIMNSKTTVIASNQNKNPANRPLASVSDSTVCYNITITSGISKRWNRKNDNFVKKLVFVGRLWSYNY